MASVSVVSIAEFRANLSQAQNPVPDAAEEPFSLLLNSVADVKAGAQRPEAPRTAERRNDVPNKQSKPEADPDKHAKRQPKEAVKPEANSQPEPSVSAKPVVAEDDAKETNANGDENAAVDALLAIALTEEQQPVLPVAGEADVVAQPVAAPVVNPNANLDGEAEMQNASALAAAAAVNASEAVAQAQPMQTKQNMVAAKPQFELAAEQDADVTVALPKSGLESVSQHSKPIDIPSSLQPQAQFQPGTVNISNAVALQGPAHLEMLNAAMNKHAQLSLGLEAGETAPEIQKPLVSSNAVAPNFAMSVQANAPVQVQAQQSVETARAVPLEQLAIEIATRASKGERRFDIRLDPPELGRIDVRLEIDSKGNTTTKLIVERAETLDMLQRDARGLEKALQNAGLKTDAGGMQFSLQQDTQAQQGHQHHAPEMRGRSDMAQSDSPLMSEVSINSASLAAQLRGGVDIRI